MPLFDIQDYDYHLPPELIAQEPADRRDESRLLVLQDGREFADMVFGDLTGLIRPGDLLVVNDTRVFPARLLGRKETGGRVEMFLLGFPQVSEKPAAGEGESCRAEVVCLLKSSKRPREGGRLFFGDWLTGEVAEYLDDGKARVILYYEGDLAVLLDEFGQVPLPPYIARESDGEAYDKDRYQTVYAKSTGAVAAPTAGLHFTQELMAAIEAKGGKIASVTLHVGYGTFSPVRVEDIRDHEIHEEYVEISSETAELINHTKSAGGRIWSVGTTTARALEFAADTDGTVRATDGWCGLYVYPGYKFRVVENLITNFHLPRSSLLFLVSALAGRERMMAAYRHAVAERYRFYSSGDAMVMMTK
ncbi:MAG: tRNA preQ1(34) S-adenosylmethionine ribosyltransferase-isomerase QueA [Thermodesulfobacteriota bacterium]